VEGAAITGLGYAVSEELRIEDGRVSTLSFGEYKVPSIADVPQFRSVFLPSDDGPTPFGGKAVGEVALSPVAPAIANAIFDAVGVRVTDLPITAEKVRRLLRASEADGSS
jgi:putative selenate reductase molybdopterin-binding subunit